MLCQCYVSQAPRKENRGLHLRELVKSNVPHSTATSPTLVVHLTSTAKA
jgi:hypothetical protein